jgi:hypothetical protein
MSKPPERRSLLETELWWLSPVVRPVSRCLCSTGPKVESGGCGMQVTGRGPVVVLINKINKVGLR